MDLKIYNVLTRKKEIFKPIEDGKVKMYACGITASGNAHIGHAYQAIIFDVIRNYLEYLDYDVIYVRNYTDVDDKIIIKARELRIDPKEYAKIMIAKTDKELATLRIKKPTIESKATECISDIIEYINKLIEKGYAYSTENGDVFYKVSAFSEYGKLSNRVIDHSISGVRKEVEPGKLDDRDFALWKNAKDDEIFWESPWGLGRPGWHIECSAMSMKYLGEMIDIHGGGRDLLFPHHENEIAQSEALTGKQFSRYWIHNGLIKVNGQKMSKSLNNGIILEDLIKEYNYEPIRMTLLENNYKSDLNITDGLFDTNEAQLYNIYKIFNKIDEMSDNVVPDINSNEYKELEYKFKNVMNNDFNTSNAIAIIFEYVSIMNKLINKSDIQKLVNIKYALINIYSILGLFQQEPKLFINEIKEKYLNKFNININEIESLISIRKQYKVDNNFIEADKVREKLLLKGIIIKDSKNETKWDIDIHRK